MSSDSPYRASIEKMEDHEIIRRLNSEMFNDEARHVAEAILSERGVDPQAPVESFEYSGAQTVEGSKTSILLPSLFAFVAAGVGGARIGAAVAGAIGAGLGTIIFAWLGWWIGSKLSVQLRKLRSLPLRFILATLALIVWLMIVGVAGVFAQLLGGRGGA